MSRKARPRVRLGNIDRLIFVWLPNVPHDCDQCGQARDCYSVASARVSRLLALEIQPSWWPSRDRPEIRDLIRRMSKENPLRGAPRIHGESVLVRTSFAKRAYKDAI